jgi:hypothetical protein
MYDDNENYLDESLLVHAANMIVVDNIVVIMMLPITLRIEVC